MPGFLSKLEPTRPRIDWQLLQEERWKRMRVIMDEEGIDAIFTNVVDSVIYLTGWPKHRTSVYPGAYGTLFLKDEVEPIIFCSEGDAGGMLADMMYPDIRVTPPWNNLWVPIIDKALSDYGLKKKNIGIEPRMPAGLYNNIVGTLDKVNFVNAVPAINRSRAVKNPEEIKAYEHTVSLVECGINAAVEAAKNSWSQYTEIDIGTIGMVELLNRGCTGPDIWVVSGERAAPVRRYSTEKIVRAGEMCVIFPHHLHLLWLLHGIVPLCSRLQFLLCRTLLLYLKPFLTPYCYLFRLIIQLKLYKICSRKHHRTIGSKLIMLHR